MLANVTVRAEGQGTRYCVSLTNDVVCRTM